MIIKESEERNSFQNQNNSFLVISSLKTTEKVDCRASWRPTDAALQASIFSTLYKEVWNNFDAVPPRKRRSTNVSNTTGITLLTP